MEQLTTALQQQAQLSQVGRIAAYFNILDHLCVRLRLLDYRARRPEVAAQQIRQPLFILGLPRTGTTILHELIGAGPVVPLTGQLGSRPAGAAAHRADLRQ